jgi:hypothetical protein
MALWVLAAAVMLRLSADVRDAVQHPKWESRSAVRPTAVVLVLGRVSWLAPLRPQRVVSTEGFSDAFS